MFLSYEWTYKQGNKRRLLFCELYELYYFHVIVKIEISKINFDFFVIF